MRPALLLGAALLSAAATLPAQQCIAPHPSGHVATIDYAVAPMPTATLAEAGFTYARRLSAAQWIGSGNSLLIEGGWHNGRLDRTSGDGTSFRGSGGATAITTIGRRLNVCASVGAGWFEGGGSEAITHLDVPAGVGLGLTIPIGGLVILPYAMPTAAYFSRSVTRDSAGTRLVTESSGRDLALTAGGALRFGRVDLRASWRLKDARVDAATIFRMQVAVWF